MKIVYLHQYFVTPDEYGGTRSYWFAKALIEKGYKVTVISALSSSTKRSVGVHNVDGINLVLLGGRYSNTSSKIRKITLFLNYLIQATYFLLLKEKNVKLVVSTSTPLTVGIIALLGKKIKGINYIFEVRDLWPEFPIQIGAISNPLLIKILNRLEKSIYNRSQHIIALSQGMKDGVLKKLTQNIPITVIPNMSKPDLFFPRDKNLDIASKYGISNDRFNIIHFGAMAPANGLDFVLNTAKILHNKGDHQICFIFSGYGAEERRLKSIVKIFHLENVIFTGKHNLFEISEIVNLCDASLYSVKNLPILETSSPNKFFDSLSAGKPIFVNSKGWIKDLVEDSECGFYVNYEDENDFIDKIFQLINDKSLYKLMSQNSRHLAEGKFSRQNLTNEFVTVVDGLNL